jgi:sulfur-carrier protein adenylyltransferase/sulfurtransferase
MAPADTPTPVQNITAEAARAMIEAARPGELTLLDVRQEPEYAEFHLPGAALSPLPDLPDRLGSLDRTKPVMVYCRSGMRSAAAAKLLSGAGFGPVMNLLGGAMAWQGAAATGGPDTGLTLFSGRESPQGILLVALGMEAKLGAFYARLAEDTADAPAKETCQRLAGFERRHLEHVHSLYRQASGDETALETLLAGASPALEGGLPANVFLEQLGGRPESAREAFELAASVEAQAFDLYTRLSRQAANQEAASLLASLAQEEKGHLRTVSNLMERLVK